ncbi:MAG TPA: chemotaxis protein CheC [Tissierellia bacterium]|nr:chemotaxis protein CheC [Tissierellia bacterium]
MDTGKMDFMIIDALKEIGNIGSGNAATALASMLSTRISMNVPKVKVIEFEKVSTLLGGEEELIAGIYLKLMKDIEGSIMFILDMESALNLVKILLGKNAQLEDEISVSALLEVGNIIASSYVNALSKLTGFKISVSVPAIAIDMAGAILSVPAIEFGLVSDRALFIETVFKQEENLVKGNLLLLPDINSFEKMLLRLGVL